MMLENESEKLVSLESRIALLQQQFIFNHWPEHLLTTLADKTFLVTAAEGALIVEEGDPITDVYLIIDGSAEVFHAHGKKPPLRRVEIVATLHRGESIGLSQFGLYSTIGVRTASVKATSELKLLALHLNDLADLLKNYPELSSKLKEGTDKIIRMKFVKQAAPFSTIAYDRLHRFMDKIATLTLEANATIFHEGDDGDYCCLIIDGTVALRKKKFRWKKHESC